MLVRLTLNINHNSSALDFSRCSSKYKLCHSPFHTVTIVQNAPVLKSVTRLGTKLRCIMFVMIKLLTPTEHYRTTTRQHSKTGADNSRTIRQHSSRSVPNSTSTLAGRGAAGAGGANQYAEVCSLPRRRRRLTQSRRQHPCTKSLARK